MLKSFTSAAPPRAIVESARAAGARAAERDGEGLEGTARELEQRARRVARGVERDEILQALDVLAGWYRDVAALGLGAGGAALNADRIAELELDAGSVEPGAAVQAAEVVAATRRDFEFNVNASLALDALFIRLRRALARDAVPTG